ncbi:MAG: response regulator [Polyangiaceae bacterium]|nr:response regulator [Polyangiaceae bacterium]
MIGKNHKGHPLLHLAMLLTAASVFVADLATPLGVTTWFFYIVPVVLSLFTWRPNLPLVVAAGCTALILTGFTLSPPPQGLSVWVILTNRLFGLVTIWGVAFVVRTFVAARRSLAERDWVREGQAKLSASMQGEQTPDELGDNILSSLCKYLGVPMGALYVREENASGSLYRIAGYSLPEKANGPSSVRLGEGLVGQAAKDNRLLQFHDVPEDHFAVTSGLGKSKPRHVLVAPAAADGTVHGALELGFFNDISPADVELLETCSYSIGIAIRSLQYRTRLEELLAETRQQTEELQSQQSRLEAQQAELEQTNAQLEEQTAAIESQRDALAMAQGELVEKANDLARANRYKSEFLANMSHELRTPLNSALILSKHLAENPEGNLSPLQVKHAEMIHASGTDLLALIDDILDLSRIEAGRMEMHSEPVELARVVEMSTRTLQPIAQEKRLGFRTIIEPGTPSVLTSDSIRIQQILRNLLSNALKFTEFGEVSLHVRGLDGDKISFTVRDTGIGIPKDKQDIIFEAFRQANGGTQRKFGGTGLGLTISRELARRLGGDIHVESSPGQGSAFTLTLPVHFVPEAAEPPSERPAPIAPTQAPAPVTLPVPQSSPALLNGDASLADATDDRAHVTPNDRTILVVEDDERFASILLDLAHELKFKCIIGKNVAEGLALAQTYHPSAIVLDMHLPDQSGLSLLERLKNTGTLRHIPVHVMSVTDYTQQALEMGAIGYALKPVKRDQIMQAFQRIERQLVQKVKRVLIIEDVAVQRESIVQLLSADNVEITSVATGAEALRQLAQTSFDCMVLDLTLPDMSGYDLLDKMASGEVFSFPPVIVYTGRSLTSDEELRLRRYTNSIVIKGARSPERLLDEVTLFLHQVESKLHPEKRRMLQAVRHREAALEGRRVLLVEDDVRNIFALSSVLERKGMKVDIARNGKEALAALDGAGGNSAAEVDLVLMDVMMPEMDGLTAMQEIRKQPELRKLPIIALTAQAMPDDRKKCLDAGANDYIPKPLDIDKLLSLVRVWMPK